MKRITVLLLVVVLSCGAFGCSRQRRQAVEPEAPPEVEQVTVLVARQKIPMGTLVREPEKLFLEKEFVKGQEPREALTSFDQVKGRRLNKPLAAGQFVTSEDLLDGKAGDLAAAILPGHRAFVIRVEQDLDADGIQPGARVDVVCTVRRGDGDSWSKIIVQDVLLLAVDLPLPASRTPTLALTPEAAEKLKLASEMGTLRLVLRQGERIPPPHWRPRPDGFVRANSPEPQLPAGMRACAIRVPSQDLPPGVRPGQHVYITWDVPQAHSDVPRTLFFMKKFPVLAVDLVRPPRPAAAIVTLAATPEEAEKLAELKAQGQLRVDLWPDEDAEPVPAPRTQPLEFPRVPEADPL